MSNSDNTPKWTLKQVQASKLELEVHCQKAGCGWFGEFDIERLIEHYGADYPLPTESLDMPCPSCGSPELKFFLATLHLDK
ncbi:MAG: hypothetical protein ACYC1L_02060 [Alphaproteobacteria bacterium]